MPLPSPEFVSYALALLAYSVRCSDVFWGANKCLSFLISLQLAANGIHALLAFCGASVLYKYAPSHFKKCPLIQLLSLA